MSKVIKLGTRRQRQPKAAKGPLEGVKPEQLLRESHRAVEAVLTNLQFLARNINSLNRVTGEWIYTPLFQGTVFGFLSTISALKEHIEEKLEEESPKDSA